MHKPACLRGYPHASRTCGGGQLATRSWSNCRSTNLLQVQAPSNLSLVRGRLDQRQYPGVEPGQEPEAATNRSITLPWLVGWLAGWAIGEVPALFVWYPSFRKYEDL